jgi:AraC family transcriptional regulator of arabinose operon
MRNDEKSLIELVQNLQIHVLTAHQTQCSPSWRDLNFVSEFNRFYYIQEGEGWLNVSGTELYPKPGQLCLMPAYMNLSYSYLSDRPTFLKYWCHFTVTAGPLDLFQWIGVPFSIDVDDKKQMTELFVELIELHTNRSLAMLLREKSIMLEIISYYLQRVPVQVLKNRSEEMDRLCVIQEYVENHLHTSVSVEEMAALLHLHPNYFISYFKKHFGIAPAKFVNRKRADLAKALLSTTSLSVKEIAARTGFEDTSHFTKFFRKESGQSPTEYRLTNS